MAYAEWRADLCKSVEDAANGSGVEEANRGKAQAGHAGMVDAPAGLPPCHQVDDRPDGHQHHVPQPKPNVTTQILSTRVSNSLACKHTKCQRRQLFKWAVRQNPFRIKQL